MKRHIVILLSVLLAIRSANATDSTSVEAIADDREHLTVGELMSTNVVIVNEDMKIANAIEVMLKKSISRLIIADNNQVLLGIVTRTDLIDSITNLKQFPIITN